MTFSRIFTDVHLSTVKLGNALSFKINLTIYSSPRVWNCAPGALHHCCLMQWAETVLLTLLRRSDHVWTASNLDNPTFETYWEYQTCMMVLVEGESLCLQETTAEEHLSIFVLPWFVSQRWCDHYGEIWDHTVNNPLFSCPNLLCRRKLKYIGYWINLLKHPILVQYLFSLGLNSLFLLCDLSTTLLHNNAKTNCPLTKLYWTFVLSNKVCNHIPLPLLTQRSCPLCYSGNSGDFNIPLLRS